jgi:hypothetical protein
MADGDREGSAAACRGEGCGMSWGGLLAIPALWLGRAEPGPDLLCYGLFGAVLYAVQSNGTRNGDTVHAGCWPTKCAGQSRHRRWGVQAARRARHG